MNKNLYLILLLFACPLPLLAQSGIGDVLKSIEANNTTLRAGQQLNQSQKLEARTGKFLPNPSVELNQLWAGGEGGGNAYEFAAVQSFDFPTTYFNKNKLSKLKVAGADYQYAVTRQQVLLKAQQACQEIIYLRKQRALLEKRLQNADQLEQLYRERLALGAANQMEYNKIQLEKVNANNASRRNAAALRAQMELLQSLNGGLPIEFSDTEFPVLPALPAYEELESAYLAADPNLRNLGSESDAAQQEVKVNRALTLPKFDLGYRRNGGSDANMNGFRIGISIPLWENRNTVRQAKAQAEYAVLNLEDNTQTLKATLHDLYVQAQALQASRDEYAETIALQRTEDLLNRALSTGQISMVDYFVEISLLYDSIQNYLDVEKEYQNVMAQLLQYQL